MRLYRETRRRSLSQDELELPQGTHARCLGRPIVLDRPVPAARMPSGPTAASSATPRARCFSCSSLRTSSPPISPGGAPHGATLSPRRRRPRRSFERCSDGDKVAEAAPPSAPASTSASALGAAAVDVEHVLALRKWVRVEPSMEFRCFVRAGHLVGISQRQCSSFFPHLLEERTHLRTLVATFIKDVVIPGFPLPDCTRRASPPRSTALHPTIPTRRARRAHLDARRRL